MPVLHKVTGAGHGCKGGGGTWGYGHWGGGGGGFGGGGGWVSVRVPLLRGVKRGEGGQGREEFSFLTA